MVMTRMRWILLAVAVAIVAVIVLVPFFVNAERFRPMIETRAQKMLGRDVHIGKLSFSVLSGSVSAKDISVADDPHFSQSPFIRAAALDLGVDLKQLIFQKSLRVTSLTLKQPQLTFIQAPDGRWNVSSLGTSTKTTENTSEPTQFLVESLKVKGGTVTIRRGGTQQFRDVGLTASNLSYTTEFPFTFTASPAEGGSFTLDGKAGPMNPNDFSQTPFHSTIKFEKVDLGKLLGPQMGMGGIVTMNGDVTSDGKTVSAKGIVNTERLKLVASGTPAATPIALDYAFDVVPKTLSGVLRRGDVHLRNSTAHVTGNFNARGNTTDLDLKLLATNIPINDIKMILPAIGVSLPAGANLDGGTVSSALSIQGPADRLTISGPLTVNNTTLAGFDMGSKLRAVAALAGINTGKDTRIQSLNTQLRMAPEAVDFSNLDAVISGLGQVTGGGTINQDHTLNIRMVAKLAGGGGVLGQLVKQAGVSGLSTVPFRIQGTTTNPSFIPDVGGMMQSSGQQNASQTPQQQQLNGLGNAIQGIFGKKKKP
jgi:AsmA protein